MQRYRPVLDTLGAGLAAAVACLALIVPVDTGCAADSSALQMTLLTITVPRATAAGAVIAVLAAVCVHMFGTRAAWGTAAVATLILATDHFLVTSTSTSLATANFVDSLGAGVLLGAAGAAALEYRPPALGYLFGALTGILVGDHLENVTGNGTRSLLERAFMDLPPSWLTIPTLILLTICYWTCRRPGAYPTTLNLPFGPVLGAAVVITTVTVVSERLAPSTASVAAIAAGVVAIAAATFVGALLLPGRDGTLTLLMVALAASGSSISYGVQHHWQVGPMLLAMTLGLGVGMIRPAPLVAAGAILALGLFDLFTPAAGNADAGVVFLGSCAVAAIAGYSFGAIATRSAPGTVLPLGILLIPSAVLTLGHRVCGTTPWYREPGSVTSNHSAWFALALGICALLGILALRRLRPEPAES
ncbi:hypothetical protein ACFXHA_35060 [Nocardia sp. NPDC059240]|uniref:hypothetical protein n=1 Tax=Nocardia sp. NPDC059240 TaxID=3346786 RepID=UPI0036A72491